jgi:uncharacterized membrane protein YfcA
MNALEVAGFIALGLVAGTYGTLVGVGGGLLIVPILLLSHIAPKEAAGTSMAVILANAASGSVSYLRQRRVDVRSAMVFTLAGLPGALLGGFFDQFVPPKLFSLLFGTFLLLMGVRFFLKPGQDSESGAPVVSTRNTAGFRPLLAAAIGLVAGFLASMFGVGGGIIFVPSMAYLFSFPAHIATATSTFIIALTAIFGTASHAYYHDVLWGPAVAIAIGAVAGAPIGARIAPRVRMPQLMRLFSLAVLLAALWLLYKALA